MKNNYKELSLNGPWQLRGEAITRDGNDAARIAKLKAGWVETPVPGDIRQGLIDAGIVDEPTLGMNSYAGAWIEDRSWWLRKKFSVTKAMIESDMAELVLDGLDANASIFLNGKHLADHGTAFRPFVMRVNESLVEGENTLLVRLTHGIEDVTPQQIADVGGEVITEAHNNNPDAGDQRRIYARKPQYSWGWDWVARIATVGITGNCALRICARSVIRNIQIRPHRDRDTNNVRLDCAVEVEWFHRCQTGMVQVGLEVVDADGKCVNRTQKETLVQGGINFVDAHCLIKNARLWWPSGMGEQYRYDIIAMLFIAGKEVHSQTCKYGIRFVELDTNDKFAFKINDKTMFCKGANWIPCDALYGRATDQRYAQLIDEAQKANFNMLRIWGGGLYERSAFYEACDQKGILIWQDFMFACAPPPDHLEWFRDEIRKEADYQTKRLRNHACIALWCGSNEVLGTAMFPYQDKQTENGRVTFGDILPRAVRKNCPEIPYWYNSPYGSSNNWDFHDTEGIGDCHFWRDAMMSPKMENRITPELFDHGCHCRFVSEYGFVGPCAEETTKQYLAGDEFDRNGMTWQHHCNSFEKGTVDAAIKKHYLNPNGLSTNEYLYYGGLVQGLMYSHSLETFRTNGFCHGGLFWMYNDCWGEVGWTIIDYYLRRKASWYFVKRALAPLRLVLRAQGNRIAVKLANDTHKAFRGTIEYGYAALDGSKIISKTKQVTADDALCSVLLTFAPGKHDPTKGVWFARIVGKSNIAPAIFRAGDFRRLKRQTPNLKHRVKTQDHGRYILKIETDTYAHAVQVKLPENARPDDNYFDILPGAVHTVAIESASPITQSDITLSACPI